MDSVCCLCLCPGKVLPQGWTDVKEKTIRSRLRADVLVWFAWLLQHRLCSTRAILVKNNSTLRSASIPASWRHHVQPGPAHRPPQPLGQTGMTKGSPEHDPHTRSQSQPPFQGASTRSHLDKSMAPAPPITPRTYTSLAGSVLCTRGYALFVAALALVAAVWTANLV